MWLWHCFPTFTATPWQKIPPIFWPRLIGQDTHFSYMSEKWDMSSASALLACTPPWEVENSVLLLWIPMISVLWLPARKNPNLWGLMMNFWLEEKVLSPTTCMTDHLLKLCRQERWWILHKEKNSPLPSCSSFPFLLCSPSIQGNFRLFQTGCFMCAASTSSEWAMDWKSCTKGFQGYQP